MASGLPSPALTQQWRPARPRLKSWDTFLHKVEKTLVSSWPREVFWLQEAAGDLSVPWFPPFGEESMGKTSSFSKGVPWRPPGKSQSFQKELECQELSLRGVLILLYSEKSFPTTLENWLAKAQITQQGNHCLQINLQLLCLFCAWLMC